MPPKTAKLKKKATSNKTRKNKKKTTQFKVDGVRFRLNDDSSWTRIEKTPTGSIVKFKPELWPEQANQLWNELTSKNLIKYGVMSLKPKQKIKKTKTKHKPKKKPEPEPQPEPQHEPQPEPETKKNTTKLHSPEKEEESTEISVTHELEQSCIELIKTLRDSVQTLTLESKEYQKLLKCVEQKNREELLESKLDTSSLYPSLDDPNFTKKITDKKEFNDVKIEEKTRDEIDNIEEESNMICSPNIDFELEPHQMFVRNFLSFQTPYNGLLLFHGLGTGKTCSSIQVCEDMRTYYNQIGIKKKIIIVASPVVQENYKLQLFDPRKLKLINGRWNIKSCTGNKFIKEVNPMNMKGLTKEKIIRQIEKIRRQSYEFMGYTEFANKIYNLVKKTKGNDKNSEKIKRRKIAAIKKEFSDRLLVIDEVHNIRTTATKGKIKRTSRNLMELVMYAQNMKILLLTATPMFNDYKEIIWLTNLLNLNDNRFPIQISDVFDKKGNFLQSESGENIGKDLLIQKLTGYVSYVAGENPFRFPYRVWPWEYNNPRSIQKLMDDGDWNYPTTQINTMEVSQPIQHLDLIITDLHPEQNKAYDFVIEKSKEKHPELNEPREGIQYTVIDAPEQALNIVYPHENIETGDLDYKALFGKTGLGRVMLYDKETKKQFKYSQKTLEKFGRIFSSDDGEDSPLRKYSAKIYSIIDTIKKSEGIILVYSSYIDGGCVPIALALEEIGITRYGDKNKSLFETPPKSSIGKYVMITGDKQLSPSNKKELKACTDSENINGEKVKVIVISRAGSEGLDFKNIRQVHILEPWFNLNRADQIIGRGVRNKSHCDLPFNKRNVQIFLYASQLSNPTIEPIDLYVYRLAEKKGIQIGKITRLLKEISVDCLINSNQQDLIESKMNKRVQLELANKQTVDFSLGYKNNSIICDFMDCDFNCIPDSSSESKEINTDSYSQSYIIMNLEKILKRIKTLYREHYIYKKTELINRINATKNYSLEQINMALDTLINDKNEYLRDILNRTGRLVNIGEFYLFQPIELDNKQITSYERRNPIDFKIQSLKFNLPDELAVIQEKSSLENENIDVLLKLQEDYIKATTLNTKSKNKTWISACSWTINNLVRFDNFDKSLLERFCLEHLFDILNINEKLAVMNAIVKKNSNIQETFRQSLLKVTNDYYVVETDGVKGFVSADYKQRFGVKKSKFFYYIFIFDESKKEWTRGDQKRPIILGEVFKTMGKVKAADCNRDLIGFLTHNRSRTSIIFKLKSVIEGKKAKSGQACPTSGENRKDIIDRVNSLVRVMGRDVDKYKMKSKTKRQDDSIYNRKTALNVYTPEDSEKKMQETEVPMTDVQLCIETEFLLRYLDENKVNDKRWFFNTLEDVMNSIKDIEKK